MATLLLDKVTKVYRPRGKAPVTAVESVDLDIGDGEIVGLLGSSGCGKTSTLRMIAGFEEVSAGEIRLGGKAIHDLPPAERDVAMAFEGYALYPPLRVRENIGFALLRGKTARSRIEERVKEVAALLEIGDILERHPTTISAGQQQRTSLARALIRQAPLSLLDEPMSQLEPQLRAILRARIKDYLIQHRMTTVFVTHDQTEAIALADRIAVMEKGVLQQFATPAELKEKPANLFVAAFIGEPPMNILDVEAVEENGRLLLRGLTGGVLRVPLPDRLAAQGLLRAGQRYALGIRPHRVQAGAAATQLSGQVLSNQWLGDQTHLGLDIGGSVLVVVTDGPLAAKVGETVPLALPPEALHLFDPDSGAALCHGLGQEVPVG